MFFLSLALTALPLVAHASLAVDDNPIPRPFLRHEVSSPKIERENKRKAEAESVGSAKRTAVVGMVDNEEGEEEWEWDEEELMQDDRISKKNENLKKERKDEKNLFSRKERPSRRPSVSIRRSHGKTWKPSGPQIKSKTWKPSDYHEFWTKAAAAANATRWELVEAPSTPCPKVFMYDLKFPFNDWGHINWTEKKVIGDGPYGDENTNGTKFLYHTDNSALTSIVQWRLMNSLCRTWDPSEAELFIVPLAPFHKTYAQDMGICKRMQGANLTKALIHLREDTAAKHVFVVLLEHFAFRDCPGFANPTGLLRRAQRISFSPVVDKKLHASLDYTVFHASEGVKTRKEYFDSDKYPNLFAMPQPSNVHWDPLNTEDPPWTMRENRDRLMLFVGGHKHGDMMVREQLRDECFGYANASVCEVASFNIHSLMEKKKTVFCLEPAGDTPFRRSIADSMAMGCIPVLFNDVSDLTSELVWGGWKDASRVLVPRDKYLGGHIDLELLLAGMPSELLATMGENIAKHGKRFQFSVRDDPGDALSVMLHGLVKEVKLQEQRRYDQLLPPHLAN